MNCIGVKITRLGTVFGQKYRAVKFNMGSGRVADVFDRMVKSFLQNWVELLLTDRPESTQAEPPVALKIGSPEIPGGKGTGGPMSRKGEDARPGPMVRGAAVSGGGFENLWEIFKI